MRKHLLAVSIFFTAFHLFAQAQSLSLDDALDLAARNNSELQSQRIQLEAAERKANNTMAAFIPSLSVGMSDTLNLPAQESINYLGVEASANLSLKADCLQNNYKLKTDLEIEKINYEIALFNVNQTVSEAFFELAGINYEIQIKAETINNLFEIFKENKSKYEKGFLSETEYLSSKILYEKSKTELNGLNLDYKQKLHSFKLILGIPLETEISLNSDLAELLNLYSSAFENYSSEIQAMLSEKKFPAVQLIEKEKLSAEQNLKAKKTGIFGPEFNISYNGGPVLNSPKTDHLVNLNNSLSVRVSIPLDPYFKKSQSQEEIKECEDEIKNFTNQLENTKQSNCLELQGLLQQLEEQTKTLNVYSELIKITKRNLKLSQNSYSRGLLDFQSLKNASSENLEIQNEYSAKLVEVLKLYSSIEQITGKKIR